MANHAAASHKVFPPDSPQVPDLGSTETPKDIENPAGPPHLDWEGQNYPLGYADEYAQKRWYSRSRYGGTLLFNLGTFIIPAIYGTLSIIWIAGIDSSLVSTGVAYTYAGVIVECFNEGLPRGVWSVTTNRTSSPIETRLTQVLTLIIIQTILGLLITIAFITAAPSFVAAFVPGEVQAVSVQYIRISSGSLVAGMLEVAVNLGTRALDHPDVPLVISSVKTTIQIILELALISTVHAPGLTPTIQTQATIRLICDLLGSLTGLAYLIFILHRHQPATLRDWHNWTSFTAFKQLFRPGKWTFLESAIRNAIYLYLVSNVVSMGSTYASAWGVFNTIRWGIIMVPVQALEATSNAFTGHRWHAIQGQGRMSWISIRWIMTPALGSAALALIFEVPICIGLTWGGAEGFARYLGGSEKVAEVTAMMWKTVDWMYICYAISTCLATILLATRAELYLLQSLVSNIGYCLPWAIVIGMTEITSDTAWYWHKWVFGGSLVFSLADIAIFVAGWAWLRRTGRMGAWRKIGERLRGAVKRFRSD